MSKAMLVLNFSLDDVPQIVLENVVGRVSISGVQRKLSLKKHGDSFIPVNNSGEYILKPQDNTWHQLPENEHLCMMLAKAFELNVPENFLVKLSDNSIAYIVKRFDRDDGKKYPMEDFCQILGLAGRQKYEGSYERIVKGIEQFSSAPGLDKINFFRQLLLNFLICNNDAHNKNFSLLNRGNGYRLSPVYDLVNTSLVLNTNKEETALSLNAKRSNLKLNDFIYLSEYLELPKKVVDTELERVDKVKDVFFTDINDSLLDDICKTKFTECLKERFNRLL